VCLAASHINDPVATVQGLYGRPDPVLSWEDDTTKKFGVETDADRLSVGPVGIDQSSGQIEAMFTVIKRDAIR